MRRVLLGCVCLLLVPTVSRAQSLDPPIISGVINFNDYWIGRGYTLNEYSGLGNIATDPSFPLPPTTYTDYTGIGVGTASVDIVNRSGERGYAPVFGLPANTQIVTPAIDVSVSAQPTTSLYAYPCSQAGTCYAGKGVPETVTANVTLAYQMGVSLLSSITSLPYPTVTVDVAGAYTSYSEQTGLFDLDSIAAKSTITITCDDAALCGGQFVTIPFPGTTGPNGAPCDYALSLVPDALYTVTMNLVVQAYSVDAPQSISAYLDPFFSIDPSNLDAQDYSLVFSPGVDNELVSSTPLPAALPLFAAGLGGLGLLGWRRKRRASLACPLKP
jgi:hypothetical protein